MKTNRTFTGELHSPEIDSLRERLAAVSKYVDRLASDREFCPDMGQIVDDLRYYLAARATDSNDGA